MNEGGKINSSDSDTEGGDDDGDDDGDDNKTIKSDEIMKTQVIMTFRCSISK